MANTKCTLIRGRSTSFDNAMWLIISAGTRVHKTFSRSLTVRMHEPESSRRILQINSDARVFCCDKGGAVLSRGQICALYLARSLKSWLFIVEHVFTEHVTTTSFPIEGSRLANVNNSERILKADDFSENVSLAYSFTAFSDEMFSKPESVQKKTRWVFIVLVVPLNRTFTFKDRSVTSSEYLHIPADCKFFHWNRGSNSLGSATLDSYA